MQERSHAFAMKSQVWLLDPRPNLPTIVAHGREGLRALGGLEHAGDARAAHPRLPRLRLVHGQGQRRAPAFTLKDALEHPVRDANRIALPPATYAHEKEKIEGRWPAAVRFIAEHGLNEFFDGDAARHRHRHAGRDVQHRGARARAARPRRCVRQHPRAALRAQRHLPADRRRVRRASAQASARILVVEEGQPEFIEQAHHHHPAPGRHPDPDRRQGHAADGRRVHRRRVRDGVRALHRDATGRTSSPSGAAAENALDKARLAKARGRASRRTCTPGRRRFCTGCPERPIFAAMKLVERELGPHHVSCDIGCHLFSILPPFNIGNTTMGYGLGGARRRGAQRQAPTSARSRSSATAASGTTASSPRIGNAVFNRSDNVHIIVDNGYSAATGGQDLLSSRGAQRHPLDPATRSRRRCAASA